MMLTEYEKERRGTAFEMWQYGKSPYHICRLLGLAENTWRNWENFFITYNKPYHTPLPARKCNLCPKKFKPETKFERFCSSCKSRAKRKEQTEYGFLPK